MIEPVIRMNDNHFHGREGRQAYEFYDEMEALRKAVKKATGYVYDNSHFEVTDGMGHPALTINFSMDHISIWSAVDGHMIGSYNRVPDLRSIVNKVEEGKALCSDCRKWFPREEMKSFSFAGKVCKGCYDPKKHLPPDTRGD